jgi:hypothetical protein
MSPQFIRGKLVRHLSKLKSPQNIWMDNISCHDTQFELNLHKRMFVFLLFHNTSHFIMTAL